MSERRVVRIVGATRQQWLVIVIAVLVFVSAFLLVFQTYLDEFVYERLLAHEYEQRFGFRGGRVRIHTPQGERSVYTLLEVTPGGPLDRAGFRAGDVPSGWNDSQVVGFMRSLASGGAPRAVEQRDAGIAEVAPLEAATMRDHRAVSVVAAVSASSLQFSMGGGRDRTVAKSLALDSVTIVPASPLRPKATPFRRNA